MPCCLSLTPMSCRQAATASMLGIVGACALRETQPFRRASDNEVAVAAQYCVACWCFSIVFRDMGISATPVLLVLGVLLVLATVAVFAFALWRASDEVRDLRRGARLDTVVSQSEAAQYLVRGENGIKKTMKSEAFLARYEPSSQPVDASLAQEGFQSFQSSARYFFHQLSVEDVASYFPSGRMGGNNKAPVTVKAGDYLALDSPSSKSLTVIPEHAFASEFTVATDQVNHQLIPSQAIVLEHWESVMRREASIYRKTVGVHAKCMDEDGYIKTVVNGKVEASTPYSNGDFIVRGSRGGNFVMCAADFASRYDIHHPSPVRDHSMVKDGFSLYQPTGLIWTHRVSAIELAVYFPAGRLTGRWVGSCAVQWCMTHALTCRSCGRRRAVGVGRLKYGRATCWRCHYTVKKSTSFDKNYFQTLTVATPMSSTLQHMKKRYLFGLRC